MALNYPLPISPISNEVIDPTIENTFKYKVQGTSACTAYKEMIYDIDNHAVYTGTKTTLATPLYNGEQLNITLAANATNCVVSNPYKHAVTMYYAEELGKTLVNNGYFYSDLSGWIYGTNWTYEASKAKCTAGAVTTIKQSINLSSNKKYRLTVTATVTAGTLVTTLGTATGSLSTTTSGTYTCDYTTTTSVNALTFTPNSSFAGTIDSIKLQLVNNNVTSQETLFWVYTTPALSINMPSTIPYNLQYYTFSLNYVQAEGIKLKDFTYTLYNSNQEVLDTYSAMGTSKTDYYKDGFMSGQTYYIQATATNQMGVLLTSALESFTVLYSATGYISTLDVVNNKEYNSVDLAWSSIHQITGVASSPSGYQYIPEFIYDTNIAAHINAGEYIEFDVDVPVDFTCHYENSIDYGYTENLFEFTDVGSNTYVLSFDGTNLIYKKNGTTLSTFDISSYGLNYWHITMLPTQAIFIYVDNGEIYPADDLYPSDTLYPKILVDS